MKPSPFHRQGTTPNALSAYFAIDLEIFGSSMREYPCDPAIDHGNLQSMGPRKDPFLFVAIFNLNFFILVIVKRILAIIVLIMQRIDLVIFLHPSPSASYCIR